MAELGFCLLGNFIFQPDLCKRSKAKKKDDGLCMSYKLESIIKKKLVKVIFNFILMYQILSFPYLTFDFANKFISWKYEIVTEIINKLIPYMYEFVNKIKYEV